jgi:hypothetical protein
VSNAVSTTGILVRRATVAAPTVFTTIGEIVSVTPPGFSRNKIETTTHNDGAESYVLGILRQKDPAFRVNWVGNDATHETIIDDLMTNLKAVWQISTPSGITMTGEGRVSRFEPVDAGSDAAQQADIAIAWAGPITTVTPP